MVAIMIQSYNIGLLIGIFPSTLDRENHIKTEFTNHWYMVFFHSRNFSILYKVELLLKMTVFKISEENKTVAILEERSLFFSHNRFVHK